MKHLLFGNGLNINFTDTTYTNKSIIIRALTNVKRGYFYNEAYTKETADWLRLLYSNYQSTLNGTNDIWAGASYEKRCLKDFQSRYANVENPKIYDIGFEDYFLLHDLYCRKNNIENPDAYNFREVLRRMFLDSIYFGGKIQKIWKKFPAGLKEFLLAFDSLYTTNYDNNIETFSGRDVRHLHGAFHILSENYDPNSFRNQLSDQAGEDFSYVNKTPYLFSNALTAFSGDIKEFAQQMQSRSNSTIEKFAEGYKNDPKIRAKIETWKDAD